MRSQFKIGSKVLVTTDNWFVTPDGRSCNAVFGTVKAITDSTEQLGIRTNARSTNWYVEVGDMLIAGCQIHYMIRTNQVNERSHLTETVHEGENRPISQMSRIYLADNFQE